MPALYTHIDRADGLTLTAAIYNADHENHITHGDAAGLGGYSANASQMQATTDPGEVSTENLAASLAGEIERLRFMIKEMKNAPQWYVSAVVRTEVVAVMHVSGTTDVTAAASWNDAVNTLNSFWWYVSDSYASGDLSFKIYRRSVTGANTAVMAWSANRIRDGAAGSGAVGTTSINFTPGDAATHATTLTVPAATFAVGDLVRIDITRTGGDGADTMASAVGFDGMTVTYTAYAGRP